MNRRARRQRQVAGGLGLVCASLLAVIYLELGDAPISRTARSMPAAAGGPAGQDPGHDLGFAMPPLAAFAEIAARPLFSPLRRPPDQPAGPAPEVDEAPARADDLLLRGVATAGSSRVALLQRRSTGELLRVLEGQTVDGWQVESIGAATVGLRADDGDLLLELEKDASPPPSLEAQRRREAPAESADEPPPEAAPEEPEAPADG